MSPRPKKNQQTSSLSEAILETAWKQIAADGAPALSLRAIARAIGITAPAIYNYFPDRNALVTVLISDAFNSLAASQREALQNAGKENHLGLVDALGMAYRQWALTYPQRYQLIFGTPVPGYHTPEELTIPAAALALAPLVESLQAVFSAGRLRTDHSAPRTPELTAMLEAWSQFAGGQDIEVLYTALVFWSRVHGLVSLEIGNKLPSFFSNPGEIYAREIKNIEIQYLFDVQEA